jgi:S1-C subfamily serine protease
LTGVSWYNGAMRRRVLLTIAVVLAAATSAFMAGLSFGGASRDEAPVKPAAAALALQASYEQVVRAVSPSVVQIETSAGLGSGIVMDRLGHIVTNAHVVGTAKTFTVTFSDGRRETASLVGTYPPNDLAVIKVPAGGVVPAAFADSSKVRVGQLAIAIGNPLGFRSSVTEGIVSALGRTVPEENGVVLPSTIQTSAPINPGNSGGALVDISGRVIGIPTLAASDPQFGSAAAGIGFAIPSNTVKDLAGQLVANGKVTNSHRAYLGVRVGDTSDATGVVVGQVTAGGPAAKAGIKAGDVIVSVNGKPTPTTVDLSTVLADLKPGDTVQVGIRHQDGTKATVSVTLGQFPTT